MFTTEFEKKANVASKVGKAIKGHLKRHGYSPVLAAGAIGTAVGSNRLAALSKAKEKSLENSENGGGDF